MMGATRPNSPKSGNGVPGRCRIAGHGTRHFVPGLPHLVPAGQNLRGPRESYSLDGHAASPIQDRYRRGFAE